MRSVAVACPRARLELHLVAVTVSLEPKGTTINAKTREQRFHELRGIAISSRKALDAVYTITFNRHPRTSMPDRDVIKEILNNEFPVVSHGGGMQALPRPAGD